MLNYFFSKLPIRSLWLMLSVLSLMACGGGSANKNGNQQGGAIQGKALSLKGEVSTFAGAYLSKDGTGDYAKFSSPSAMVRVGGNLYIADALGNVIRKMVIATGVVTTLAGKSGLEGSADGTGEQARFLRPLGITSDGSYLYVTDFYNSTIRKIEIATGAVSTLAGLANTEGSVDGVGAAARFVNPEGIATDGYNLFVTDSRDMTIRKIVIATGEVTTFAGESNAAGINDGVGSAARFIRPACIVSDGVVLYICDGGAGGIRKILIATGEVTTILGATFDYAGFLIPGPIGYPAGIAVEGDNLYVSDAYTNTILKVAIATAQISVLAGSRDGVYSLYLSQDGTGSAARFHAPSAIVNYDSNLYVAESGNNTIRKIDTASGAVTTVAGSLNRVFITQRITSDRNNIYLSSEKTIYKIAIVTGLMSAIAGSPGDVGFADGIGDAAQFYQASAMTTDGSNLYLVDGQRIRKIAIASGLVTTLPAISPQLVYPRDITTDGVNLYLLDSDDDTIRKVVIATGASSILAGAGTSGYLDGVGQVAKFNKAQGITTDGIYLYVADSGNQVIRKIVIATGEVTTLAGTQGVIGSGDGMGLAATFNTPAGLVSDGTHLYISDSGNGIIRKLTLATGQVNRVVGSTAGHGGYLDAIGAVAEFGSPLGITTDGKSLYVADAANFSIRKVD